MNDAKPDSTPAGADLTSRLGAIRLVVSDMDDTLLDRQGQLPPEAAALVRRLRERGIGFSLISGRPPFNMRPLAGELGLKLPLVCYNGGLIIDGEQILRKHALDFDALLPALEAAVAHGLTTIIGTAEQEYTLGETDWIRSMRPLRAFPLSSGEALRDKLVVKAEILDGSYRDRLPLIESELVPVARDFGFTRYADYACEVVAPGVNKASGLDELAAYMGLELSQILAIGDNHNDIEMLGHAGIGMAVANAKPRVLDAADHVLSGARSEGVIEALNWLLEVHDRP